jgi:hypothetical protein
MADSTSQEFLSQIDESLARHSQQLDAAIDVVLDQQVTDYPILVWQREADIELGVMLFAEANPGQWQIRMTTLEEMAAKKLILPERIADFRKVFTNARS